MLGEYCIGVSSTSIETVLSTCIYSWWPEMWNILFGWASDTEARLEVETSFTGGILPIMSPCLSDLDRSLALFPEDWLLCQAGLLLDDVRDSFDTNLSRHRISRSTSRLSGESHRYSRMTSVGHKLSRIRGIHPLELGLCWASSAHSTIQEREQKNTASAELNVVQEDLHKPSIFR